MDISVFGLGTVAAITVLCYLAGTGVKTTPLDNKYCLLYTSDAADE